ncbi:UNVERIFIED_ORG: hypothetical protein ABIB52_001862 [Arthrobacter sp. UYCu721]
MGREPRGFDRCRRSRGPHVRRLHGIGLRPGTPHGPTGVPGLVPIADSWCAQRPGEGLEERRHQGLDEPRSHPQHQPRVALPLTDGQRLMRDERPHRTWNPGSWTRPSVSRDHSAHIQSGSRRSSPGTKFFARHKDAEPDQLPAPSASRPALSASSPTTPEPWEHASKLDTPAARRSFGARSTVPRETPAILTIYRIVYLSKTGGVSPPSFRNGSWAYFRLSSTRLPQAPSERVLVTANEARDNWQGSDFGVSE